MYSVKDDTVIDPFLGTGTTTIASMVAKRNSIGFEIEKGFKESIFNRAKDISKISDEQIKLRLENHALFVRNRLQENKEIKYVNKNYGFPVITRQECELILDEIKEVIELEDEIHINYRKNPSIICKNNEIINLNNTLLNYYSSKNHIQ